MCICAFGNLPSPERRCEQETLSFPQCPMVYIWKSVIANGCSVLGNIGRLPDYRWKLCFPDFFLHISVDSPFVWFWNNHSQQIQLLALQSTCSQSTSYHLAPNCWGADPRKVAHHLENSRSTWGSEGTNPRIGQMYGKIRNKDLRSRLDHHHHHHHQHQGYKIGSNMNYVDVNWAVMIVNFKSSSVPGGNCKVWPLAQNRNSCSRRKGHR